MFTNEANDKSQHDHPLKSFTGIMVMEVLAPYARDLNNVRGRLNGKGEIAVQFEFNPEVRLLLVNHSDAKVRMIYDGHAWPMSEIGWRPPFYTNPRYGFNYPII
ncbi:hypothetical protein [Peribacillus sp. SCS-155]|uniref:hypothetical protein n=1 Tax=Peribacillus sedimenti TaxID=3115297 RepID=UPI003906D40F